MNPLARPLKLACAILAAVFLTVSHGAAQQVLYGADGGGGNPLTNLYILNPTNGSILSTVGPIGFANTGAARRQWPDFPRAQPGIA